MSDSRRVNPLRRIILVAAATGVLTAVLATAGLWTLTGSGSFFDACRAIIGDEGTPWQIQFGSYATEPAESAPPVRCVVMTDPGLVDSGLAAPSVPPGLLNADEVFRALGNSILGISDEMGTEGVAVAHFLVDETGTVQQQRIAESSGSPALDEALLAVGPLASLSPAETEEGPTEAWVALTVGFATKQSRLDQLRETLERWRNQAET